MKNNKLGITKGVAVMYPSNTNLYTPIYVGDKYVSESKHYGMNNNPDIKEGLANASLIADAFNTANKCGLLPSELLEQRDELLELLRMCYKSSGNYGHLITPVLDEVRDTINQIEQ